MYNTFFALNYINDQYFLQGNRLFKEGKFELAKAKYEKVCICLLPCLIPDINCSSY